MTHQAIKTFWTTFRNHQSRLKNLKTAEDPAYDAVLDALHGVNPDLYFLFSSGSDGYELVITAEGDLELFPLVDEIVANAPTLDDWQIHALVPQLGFPQYVAWEGSEVCVDDVYFLFDKDPEQRTLNMFVDGLKRRETDNIHNALLRALDSGLGERQFAESIQRTCVFPLSQVSKAQRSQLLPLTELPRETAD